MSRSNTRLKSPSKKPTPSSWSSTPMRASPISTRKWLKFYCAQKNRSAWRSIKSTTRTQIAYDLSFHSLGIQTIVIAVSAAQGWHIAELLETALKTLSRRIAEDDGFRFDPICIVGRPNVGKSSLVNYLLDEERCIVSPIPGTTRDSIDITFLHGESGYTLIDTAGIRAQAC